MSDREELFNVLAEANRLMARGQTADFQLWITEHWNDVIAGVADLVQNNNDTIHSLRKQVQYVESELHRLSGGLDD